MLINEKEFIKNFVIQELEKSNILLAKHEIIEPEKRIVLLDEISVEERTMLKKLGYDGGIIL